MRHSTIALIAILFIAFSVSAYCDALFFYNASWTEDSTAVASKNPKPTGCLAPWPAVHTFQGRFIGDLEPGASYENPPIPSRGFLFLWLGKAISVCSEKDSHYLTFPAYKNVRRIKIVTLTPADYEYVKSKWKNFDVRIKSTIHVAETIGQEPGPIVFDNAHFKICLRPQKAADHNKKFTTTSKWTCLSAADWYSELPQ